MVCDVDPPVQESEKEDFIEDRLRNASSDKIAIVLVGGPGSGKSVGKGETIRLMKKEEEDFANIDPDEILTGLYNNNNNCYGEVAEVNNKSFDLAMEQNKNIIFDGTGRNFEWYSANVIQRLKKNGYTVNLVIVMNNPENVFKRIERRASQTGRDVDKEYTESVYKALEEAIPQYRGLSCDYVDNIYVFDNSKHSISLNAVNACKDGKIVSSGTITEQTDLSGSQESYLGGKKKSKKNVKKSKKNVKKSKKKIKKSKKKIKKSKKNIKKIKKEC